MKPVVFIHTNDQQLLAATVSAYSLKTRSATPEAFDVRFLRLEDTPHLYGREGQRYLNDGALFTWHNRDLQSFSPLRRMVPEVMGFQGRALVLDPDVFAIGDVCELLDRDMCGKAIICRTLADWSRSPAPHRYSSSVMLLECARLTHWRWTEQIDALFARRLDFDPWIGLKTEAATSIGMLEAEWNDFDCLTERTKLLHYTQRLTQPWKTGLPIDFNLNFRAPCSWLDHAIPVDFQEAARRFRRRLRQQVYRPHPDPRQERLFFSLLQEALDRGAVTEACLVRAMRRRYLRRDALAVLRRLRGAAEPARPQTVSAGNVK